jgi:hypothetical protein
VLHLCPFITSADNCFVAAALEADVVSHFVSLLNGHVLISNPAIIIGDGELSVVPSVKVDIFENKGEAV